MRRRTNGHFAFPLVEFLTTSSGATATHGVKSTLRFQVCNESGALDFLAKLRACTVHKGKGSDLNCRSFDVLATQNEKS